MIIRFLKDESGATAVEYGLIAAVLSLTIVGAVGTAGESFQEMFTNLANWFRTGQMP